MPDPAPQTAMPGRSRSSHQELARGLGYFSIALGVAEMIMPRTLSRALGLKGYENVVRLYGVREIATGVAILNSHDPTPWIVGRLAGDAADMGTVATALDGNNPKKGNALLALAMIAGVTALDVICATGLSSEKGNRRTARADYGDRSGYPGGVETARGAAHDAPIPDDMRIPAALRPWSEGRPADPARLHS